MTKWILVMYFYTAPGTPKEIQTGAVVYDSKKDCAKRGEMRLEDMSTLEGYSCVPFRVKK